MAGPDSGGPGMSEITREQLAAMDPDDTVTFSARDFGCFVDQITKADAALARVVQLHRPNEWGKCVGCSGRCGCFEGDMDHLNTHDTCPTIKAIMGDQS